MPALQVIILEHLRHFEHSKDRLYKWFNLPYTQVMDHIKKSEQLLSQEIGRSRNDFAQNPFLDLLPAIGKAYYLSTRLDRDIAMLRAVEAVRIYLANHDGRLPETAEAITEVPLPIDPLSGKPFHYKLENGKAIIDSPGAADRPKDHVVYEITVARKENGRD